MKFWDQLGAVVLDMDGVLYLGPRPRPGVVELLRRLVEEGIPYHVLTNTSASTSEEISAKLGRMGLPVEAERITNASEVVVSFLKQKAGTGSVFTLGGGSGLAHALRAAGIEALRLEQLPLDEVQAMATRDGNGTRPLLLGWTRDYDYEAATKVLRLAGSISEVLTASADRSYPDETGEMPGVRWLSASVGALLGKEPINPAKPEAFAVEHVLRKLQRPASGTVLIGDSLSDVVAGNSAGCRTVLVLGGVTAETDLFGLKAGQAPQLVIRELTELL